MLSVRKIEAVPTGVNDRPKLMVKIIGGYTKFHVHSSHPLSRLSEGLADPKKFFWRLLL